jgi:HK97 family phage prohead protease
MRFAEKKTKLDYRCFAVRAVSDESDGFSGYASTFWAVDSYATAMAPGAFKRTIKNKGEQRLVLWQHDAYFPIGKTTSLAEDDIGLAFDAAISVSTQTGADAMALLRDGVPLGMSFGFQTVKDRSAEESDPLDFSQNEHLRVEDVRVITEVNFWEASLVTFPANEAAVISAVRAEIELDAITTLTQAIRAGTLDEEKAALVAELVAAHNERPGLAASSDDQHSTRREQARRQIDIDLSFAKYRGILSGVTIS